MSELTITTSYSIQTSAQQIQFISRFNNASLNLLKNSNLLKTVCLEGIAAQIAQVPSQY